MFLGLKTLLTWIYIIKVKKMTTGHSFWIYMFFFGKRRPSFSDFDWHFCVFFFLMCCNIICIVIMSIDNMSWPDSGFVGNTRNQIVLCIQFQTKCSFRHNMSLAFYSIMWISVNVLVWDLLTLQLLHPATALWYINITESDRNNNRWWQVPMLSLQSDWLSLYTFPVIIYILHYGI